MNQPTLGSDLSLLRVNTDLLWKVTLGFLPGFVNLHKRLYSEGDAPHCEEPISKEIEVSSDEDEIPQVEYSDISSDESSCASRRSCRSACSKDDKSVAAAASCGGYPSDENSQHSLAYSTTTFSTYSGSFYDFARPSWWKSSSSGKKEKKSKSSKHQIEADDEKIVGLSYLADEEATT